MEEYISIIKPQGLRALAFGWPKKFYFTTSKVYLLYQLTLQYTQHSNFYIYTISFKYSFLFFLYLYHLI